MLRPIHNIRYTCRAVIDIGYTVTNNYDSKSHSTHNFTVSLTIELAFTNSRPRGYGSTPRATRPGPDPI